MKRELLLQLKFVATVKMVLFEKEKDGNNERMKKRNNEMRLKKKKEKKSRE